MTKATAVHITADPKNNFGTGKNDLSKGKSSQKALAANRYSAT